MARTRAEIHAIALEQFNRIQSAQRNERLQCLQDRRFYSIAGAQWEGPLEQQFANKPKFEINKVHLSVIRIFNEYRNNRITVNFVSKDGDTDTKLADACNGLYRADEQDSVAEEAYDNAFEEAVGGGFGAWRLKNEFENEDDDDSPQRIRFEPIFDADNSVFFDLDAKRQDKSDAKHCFVLESKSRQWFEDEYGEDPASWPKEIHQSEFDWATPDVVYIASYYVVERIKEELRIFRAIDGSEETYSEHEFEEDEELLTRLEAMGSRLIRTKTIKTRKVRKYLMSGGGILEDCGHIAGKNIPIVPVYGKRWFVDNVERCMGQVRLAKDSQRLKNMQISKLGEISALSAVEKPMLTPEQVAGHEMRWARDNIENYPYMLINPITDASGQSVASGPVAYTKPPQVPAAMAALLQITEQDMKDVLGNQDQAEKVVSNISGKAVELIQTRLDMQTFIYISNMAKAIKRCGEIWLSMAKEIYVEEGRKMKTIGKMDNISTVMLKKPMMDKETGAVNFENDLEEANFDVAVDVGPSSSSRRAATVKALTGMMAITQDPEAAQVLQAMAMMNMEGEGIEDVREFFRKKLVNMGAVKPNEEEAMQMEAAASQQQPDPQAQLMNSMAEEASAKAAAARADTINTIADAELKRAKTMQTIADVDMNATDLLLKAKQTLGQTPQV